MAASIKPNRRWAGVLAVICALAYASTSHAGDTALETLLRSKDQALLDAIASGNKAVWADALAPGAIILDENGAVISGSAFLDQIQPLPPNTSGHIEIGSYQLTRAGDVAVVIHRDNETEFYHGQTLHQRFWNSETWRDMPSGWKLLLFHESMVLEVPPAVALPADVLTNYVGRYSAGPDLAYVISLKDGVLMGGREGRPSTPLLAETRDVLFSADQPRVRKIFSRDGLGAIAGFVDRREGNDLVWTRQLAAG